MENHSIESGEATFSALSLLVHFRESLLSVFSRAPAGFSRESALGALPNGALVLVLPASHSQLATQFSRTGIVKIFESRSLHCFLLYLPFSSNAQLPDLVIVVIKILC